MCVDESKFDKRKCNRGKRMEKMKASEDMTTATVEENSPAESLPFPKLSVLPMLTEFTSTELETTVNEIRTCFEIATRDTVAAGQSSALFTINAVKQGLRSFSMQSLLARQSNFQSSSTSTFANEHASSSYQSDSLLAVDCGCKSHEFSNSSWYSKENDHSPSTNWEDVSSTQTLETRNPSIPDTKSPFDMQTLLASLGNLPENVQHQVMYKLYMLGDSSDRSNVSKDIPEGCSSTCAGGTKPERTVASTLAVYSASNKGSIMDIANGKDSSNQSRNDSDSKDEIEQSRSKELTPLFKYDNDKKCLMIDFQLKANAPDGTGSQLAQHLNSKCIFSDKLHFPSFTSQHVQSLHSSELQNNQSSDEMRVRFDNWHLSNNTKQQSTEEKCDLTSRGKKFLLSPKQIWRMSAEEPRHVCTVCKTEFKNANRLKVHLENGHKESYSYSYTVCKRKLDSYLTQHMHSHGVNQTHKCEICGETFNYEWRLVRHKRLVHYEVFSSIHPSGSMLYPVCTAATKRSPRGTLSSQLFPCVFCGKEFSEKGPLSEHMKSHEFRTTYECETCGRTFDFQSSLAKHRSVHSDADRHACLRCGVTFSKPSILKRHLLTHSKSTNVNLQMKKTLCAIPRSRTEPNPTAMSRRGLKKEFACTFCDKSFDKETLLSQHMKSHEWRSSYKCEICGEIFNFQSSLMKHQSAHCDGHTSPPGISSSY